MQHFFHARFKFATLAGLINFLFSVSTKIFFSLSRGAVLQVLFWSCATLRKLNILKLVKTSPENDPHFFVCVFTQPHYLTNKKNVEQTKKNEFFFLSIINKFKLCCSVCKLNLLLYNKAVKKIMEAKHVLFLKFLSFFVVSLSIFFGLDQYFCTFSLLTFITMSLKS